MKTYKKFNCDNCLSLFQREARQCHKQRKHNFCSKKCSIAHHTKSKIVQCTNCNESVLKTNSELKAHQPFCSKSCSALFNNQKRINKGYSTKGNLKDCICLKCNNVYAGSIHSSINKMFCEVCSKENFNEYHKNYLINLAKNNFCKICNLPSNTVGKYCDECRHTKISQDAIQKVKNGLIGPKANKCVYEYNGNSIHCDSKIEYTCLNYFETNYNVIDMKRSDKQLKYFFNGKNKLFLPDFEIQTTESTYIVECKSNTCGKTLNIKWHNYKETSKIKKETLFTWCELNGYNPFWFTKELNLKFYNKVKPAKIIPK